jgi:medium-chain acyl-[acyl-carrier-protein] hydrolase
MEETIEQKWLPASGSDSGIRLFCFPHAGGNSSVFQGWKLHLPENLKVNAVELPGRQYRFKEPAVDRIARLVPALVRELRPWMTFPLALFGHSLGALLVFEFAREMRRVGLPAPTHCFVSSYAAPQLSRPNTSIHKLSEPLFLRRVSPLLPLDVLQNKELLSVILPTLRADFALSETYEYAAEPPLDCPITALGGAWDLSVHRADLEMWQQQTSKDFSLKLFPGEHYYLRTAPAQLFKTIRETLERYV